MPSWVKVQKNHIYLISLCLHEQFGDTIVDGWPQLECNFNVFADMILPYGSHCIDMTTSARTYQRHYRFTGTWFSCFATYDWLRAHMHLHCDFMIATSTTNTWWSCRSSWVNLACLRKKICHQNTMSMRWKVWKFKDEDLKKLRTPLKFWSATMFEAAVQNFGPLHNFEPPTVIADAVPRATHVFSLASVGHVTSHMVSHMVQNAQCRLPYWKILTVNNLAKVF